MIREYTAEEHSLHEGEEDKLTKFMKGFEQATEEVKVDMHYAWSMYDKMMQSGAVKVWVAETDEGIMQGAIGVMFSKDLHKDKKIAVELFWFVDPTYKGIGKLLFNKYEEEAIKVGCKMLAMIHLSDSYPESLKEFYIKNGYHLTECHYIKEI